MSTPYDWGTYAPPTPGPTPPPVPPGRMPPTPPPVPPGGMPPAPQSANPKSLRRVALWLGAAVAALMLVVGVWGVASFLTSGRDDRDSVVVIATDDGFATGVVIRGESGRTYVATTWRAVSRAGLVDLFFLDRSRGKLVAASHPSPVVWSSREKDLALMDVSSVPRLRVAKLASNAELDQEPARASLTIWGSTADDLGDVGRSDLVALPGKFIGRSDIAYSRIANVENPRRGPDGVDVWVRSMPFGFEGAPAFDDAHRVVGIVLSTRVSSEEKVSLVSSQELTEAMAACAKVDRSKQPAGEELLKAEHDRVARLFQATAPAWKRVREEYAGALPEKEEKAKSSGRKGRRPSFDELDPILPDPADYLAPSDLRMVDLRDSRKLSVAAYHVMTELLSLGGLSAKWEKVEPVKSDVQFPPGAQEYRITVNSTEMVKQGDGKYEAVKRPSVRQVCLVEEHGRQWLSPFACGTKDRKGKRRTLAPYVEAALRYDEVIGKWRINGMSSYLSSADPPEERNACRETYRRYMHPSFMTIRRDGAGLFVQMDTEEILYRPGAGACTEKKHELGRFVTRLTMERADSAGVSVYEWFNGRAWMPGLVDQFRIKQQNAFGSDEGTRYWFYFELRPFGDSMLIRPYLSFDAGDPTTLVPWDDGLLRLEFAGMAGTEEAP